MRDGQSEIYGNGLGFFSRGDYENAIECFKQINTRSGHYNYSQFKIGYCYLIQENYSEAIRYYDKVANEVHVNNLCYYFAQSDKAYCLVELDYPIVEIKDCISKVCYAISAFSAFSAFSVFNILARKYQKIDKKILLLCHILDYKFENNLKDFFCDTLRKGNIKYGSNEYENLRDVYLASLKVISLLQVNHKEENRVAHYTTPETAEHLILKYDQKNTSPLRMSSAATTNDPSEGKILLKSLGITNNIEGEREDYLAFMGCFTFNLNSLNQFRLYGKENGNEATGLSIGVNMSLFSDNLTSGIGAEYFFALYRCMYMDPSRDKIISVGQRDKDSILLDSIQDSKECLQRRDAYEDHITDTIDKLQKATDQLKRKIQKLTSPTFDTLVAELLIGVRYLTKHAAFKEENECRIFCIENEHSEKIKCNQEGERKYIEYRPILGNIVQIYFAPKADRFEERSAKFKKEKPDIECIKSMHPFA